MYKFKQILLNIARLPSLDQHWILRRLSNEQRVILERWQGLTLLQQAQGFRTLKTSRFIKPSDDSPPMPALCQQLATKSPLYAAIIIDQGLYPWSTLFLQQFDKDGVIKTCLDNHVRDIKPLVKQTLFSEWENAISFESYLKD